MVRNRNLPAFLILGFFFLTTVPLQARQESPRTNGAGFNWQQIQDHGFYGATLPDGTVLIPVDEEYTLLSLERGEAPADYFLIGRNGKLGACTVDGQLIVPAQHTALGYSHTRGFTGSGGEALEIWLGTDGSAYGGGLPRRYRKKPAYPSGVCTAMKSAATDTIGTASRETQEPYRDNSPASSTEILSLNDRPASSSNNIFPQALRQGSYGIVQLSSKGNETMETDGVLVYNKPTRSIYIYVPQAGLCLSTSDLAVRQKVSDDPGSSNSLVYSNTDGAMLMLKDFKADSSRFMTGFRHNGTVYVVYARRDSYKYLSPSEISRMVNSWSHTVNPL